MNVIVITQGDSAILQLTATDGNGNPINITGASFSTQMLGPNGVIVTFANTQHAIVSATTGQFTLTLTSANTLSLGLGQNKDILTTITQGGLPVTYRARILTVLPPVPIQ